MVKLIDNKPNILIGASGFIGKSLLLNRSFDLCFRSNNISEINNINANLVICSAPSAKKWYANKFPEEDLINIKKLTNHLKTIKCKNFVLISTVDVYSSPKLVYENTKIDEINLHAYGLNRRFLEKFVENYFDSYLIIRLPGVVGKGLKKNALYDLKFSNQIEKIDCRSVFQFYPIKYLWKDIEISLMNNLKILNLSTEPISIKYIAKKCFNTKLETINQNNPPIYDMRSNFAELLNGKINYHYDENQIIDAIIDYSRNN